MSSTVLSGSLVASLWRATSKAIRPGSRDSEIRGGSRLLIGEDAGAETRPRCTRTAGFRAFGCAWRRGADFAGALRGAARTWMPLGTYGEEGHFGDECHSFTCLLTSRIICTRQRVHAFLVQH